ncbi:lectin-like domain-containing protein, partial [Enterobacter cloacae complex sp.6701430]|uniref:lectin-like domain-containing protein n=1 Tax=Enterobacter cloacae complex sp.6701430 TaxID=3397176 RepID=UPI003AAB7B1D
MSQSFNMQGFVDLGNKNQINGGGDGISFVFQPGDTNVIGFKGGAMSFGGVQGAFGFKLDTFFNGRDGEGYVSDPEQFGPKHGHGVSFGAFVDGTSGIATTINDGAQ